jgi:L,D-transpeptidase catalytic domain
MKRRLIILVGLLAVVVVIFSRSQVRDALRGVWRRTAGRATVAERINQYGEKARLRLQPYFAKAGLDYPPKQLALLGLKTERELQVYAAGANGAFRFVRKYPVLAASGVLGPKLEEGDSQVPEGIYRIESQNPNSLFHLSLRIGYPNGFDREQAGKEGRTQLGGDIMIHGSSASIGCLAMGDEAAEDLFVLAADSGLKNISVVLSPVDFRLGKTVPPAAKLPPWTEQLYAEIKSKLQQLPLENK